MTEPLRVDRRDAVTVLTLNVPERRNAMTAELTAAWVAAVDALRADTVTRAVVVTGEGSAFCAGGDLSWIGESPDLTVMAVRERMLPFYRQWLSVRDLPVPVIAAVNGPAVGAGLCLALACDIRYAARDAVFSAPFARLGMHPGMAATYLLPEVVGLARARELLLTGRRVGADEAERLGLVSAVSDDVLATALEAAEGIAASAPIAVRLTKAALAHAPHQSLDAALDWEGLAQPLTLTSADLREGLAAQAERRTPRFTGS
ncbi:MAG TPA: enoyl-CoA hydratase/isomerase family protein [Mycobacteriales bacterium]|jgi:enoyl-CoA hydratase|nr:enoyl-CoA hydratase/isomerase family protein [Mycobacteriales bacterium]